MDTSTQIAHGGQPAWSETFEHPEHGPLTFQVRKLPTARDWLDHAMAQQVVGGGLVGAASVLAAAIAGMQTFLEPPVIREDREEDPGNPTHVKITRIRYDPLEDENIEFPVRVWEGFLNWRIGVLSSREDVKKSSGAVSQESTSSEVSGASPATTPSPQPILG